MVAYAFFGSSRQLIVGPDAATCAVIAAVVTPLAAGNMERHWQLTIMMTAMMGAWCLLASRFKLGALADLLSRPILSGLLNGVAITIMVDQIGKVLGFGVPPAQLIERIYALPGNLMHSDWLTMAVSLLTLVTLLGFKKWRPNWPAPLFAIVLAAFVTWIGGLQQHGVVTVGGFSDVLPIVQWPDFQPGLLRDMVIPALNLAVVSFVSMMLTARSFAAKNGYEVNADAEFRALGLVNIVSALSQGFAISGADSRTAVNDANGGKSQLVWNHCRGGDCFRAVVPDGAAAVYSGGGVRRSADVCRLVAAGFSGHLDHAPPQCAGLQVGNVHLHVRAAGGGDQRHRPGGIAGADAVPAYGISPDGAVAGCERRGHDPLDGQQQRR